jgi:hypothetical protein
MEGKCPEKGHSRKGVKKKKKQEGTEGKKEERSRGVVCVCACSGPYHILCVLCTLAHYGEVISTSACYISRTTLQTWIKFDMYSLY